jgi:hypothetical protein
LQDEAVFFRESSLIFLIKNLVNQIRALSLSQGYLLKKYYLLIISKIASRQIVLKNIFRDELLRSRPEMLIIFK